MMTFFPIMPKAIFRTKVRHDAELLRPGSKRIWNQRKILVLVGVFKYFVDPFWNGNLRVFTGFHGFYVKKCRKRMLKGFSNYRKNCQLMYSDAEFDVDSDFAIKHCLKLWFDWVLVDQSQNGHLKFPKNEILHIGMAVNPVKIDYFSISAAELKCRIRWRIWVCYQTLPGSMIWLRYGRSKSKRAVQ